jgi:hypothetical protein
VHHDQFKPSFAPGSASHPRPRGDTFSSSCALPTLAGGVLPSPRDGAAHVPSLAIDIAGRGGARPVVPRLATMQSRNGRRHTTAPHNEGETTHNTRNGRGPSHCRRRCKPRNTKRGGVAPPAANCATHRGEGPRAAGERRGGVAQWGGLPRCGRGA